MDSSQLTERTFIITGGNSGLGYRCAHYLAAESHANYIVLASRNMDKSRQAAKQIIKETQNPNIHALSLNLASLTSVKAFSQQFSDGGWPPLCGLACNAIAGSSKLEYTEDGFEMTFGTGHLGHFLLTHLLLREMKNGGRIIFVSSDQHQPPRLLVKLHYIDALDLAYPKGGNHTLRYSATKLCNLYCTYQMASRITAFTFGQRVTINAFNPGFMAGTGLADRAQGALERAAKRIAPLLARWMGTASTAEKSGQWLAKMLIDPSFEGITGRYFDRGRETPSSELSYNEAHAINLWNRSMELTGIKKGTFFDALEG